MINHHLENEFTEFKIHPFNETNKYPELNSCAQDLIKTIDYLWEKLWSNDDSFE